VSRIRLLLCLVLVACVAAPVAGAATKAKGKKTPPATPIQITPVGRLPFPERGYVIDLPVGAAISRARVHVSENGLGMGEFTFDSLSSSGVSYGTILALDASDSMAGAPEAGAVQAARTFVSRRAPSQEIGIVTFNGAVTVLREPTIDAGALQASLAQQPRLSYGTHLFDGVQRALQLLASKKVSAGSIVLLSDGADVGSKATLKQVVALAKRQHARVFTVGLRSGAFDAKTLQAIASQTGGTYAEASSPTELADIYAQLGSKLAREYLLTYRSLAAPGSPVDVSVTLDGVGASTAHYKAPTPSELPPYHRPFWRRVFLSGWTFFFLAIAVMALIGFAIRLALDAARSRFLDRVRGYAADDSLEEAAEQKKREEWRRRASRARASGSTAARGWLGKLDEQIDIGRINVSSRTIVVVTVCATVVAVVLLGTISVFFAVLGFATPLLSRAWVRWKVRKVRNEFAEQLPPNLQVLTAGLRAGFTLLGALVAMVENAGEPSRSEFERAIADEQLGVPLEEAIRRVAKRMASRDLEQVALLAELLRTTGGNAAEVLDVVVGTVRERQDIRRLVQTLTAQGRLARWILTALPIVTGLAFWGIQPDIVGPTWHTSGGQFFLLVAAVMVMAGSWVIQKIIEIEV
jgi:tight adherence protein B